MKRHISLAEFLTAVALREFLMVTDLQQQPKTQRNERKGTYFWLLPVCDLGTRLFLFPFFVAEPQDCSSWLSQRKNRKGKEKAQARKFACQCQATINYCSFSLCCGLSTGIAYTRAQRLKAQPFLVAQQ